MGLAIRSIVIFNLVANNDRFVLELLDALTIKISSSLQRYKEVFR